MKRSFDSNEISSLLKNIIGQKKNFNHQKMLDSLVLVNINQFFMELLPELLINHIQIYKFHSGILYIHADHGIYAQQIQFKVPELIKKIHNYGITNVDKIEVRIGKVSPVHYKTGDIMSRNQKMSPVNEKIQPENGQTRHDNIDQIDLLIKEINKFKK